jgi:C-5 cytosine-specific DNA methylase
VLVTVMIDGEQYAIVDIGMRMLTPRELFRAQGFPAEYCIDPEHDGGPLIKTAQIRMCGNSVCPPMAAAIVRAQFAEDSRSGVTHNWRQPLVITPTKRRCPLNATPSSRKKD